VDSDGEDKGRRAMEQGGGWMVEGEGGLFGCRLMVQGG
jgi:hypothetical protein